MPSRAVGFSGQMHGSTLLDASDEVIRPALLWCDQRTDRQCQQITETIGAARLIELTFNPALTGFTAPKLLWVREHEPDTWRDVRSVLLPKDYVRFRLTGHKATDVADASGTLLFDVGARKWSDTVLRELDLKPSLMPEAFESPMVTGSVSPAGAEATGLKVGHAGRRRRRRPGGWRRRHGHRARRRGQRDHRHLRRRLCGHRSARARTGRPHPHLLSCGPGPLARHGRHAGRGPVAALVPRPVRRGAATTARDPYERMTEAAATAPVGSDGVLWAPYLMGERTPHLDPHARAALVGLSGSHTRAHVVRAVLEGVAFSLKDSFSIFEAMQVPVSHVRLGGGGARSALWRRIQADTYGYPVEIVAAEEGAAYGAALLAGVGAGVWRTVDEACDAVVRVVTRIEPNSDRSSHDGAAVRAVQGVVSGAEGRG